MFNVKKIKNKTKEVILSILKFKIRSNIWLLMGIFIFLVALVATPVILTTNYLTEQKAEAEQIASQEENNSLRSQLDSYKEEVSSVVEIRDNYRNSIREIVELLYAKDTHLGIGGSGSITIESSDQINLLTIRNIIATMEDDQRLLAEVRNYLTVRREFIESFPYTWPVDTGGVPHISSGWGFREDLFIEDSMGLHLHAGIDIDLDVGTAVVSTADGIVLYSYYHEQFGNIIVIKHQNEFTTSYAHMDERHVRAGDVVKRGDQIGTVGSTGLSTGPHIHYEIRQSGVSLDPMIFLSTNF